MNPLEINKIYYIWCRYANIIPDDFDCNIGDPVVGERPIEAPVVILNSEVLIGIKNVIKRISRNRDNNLSVIELDLLANVCTVLIHEILYTRKEDSKPFMNRIYTLLSHPNNVKELFVDHTYEYSQVIDNYFDLIQVYVNYLVSSAAYHRPILKAEARTTT